MAFAEPDDVATRLGRELTEPEEGVATSVIITVTGLIAALLDQDAEWVTDLDPVPAYFQALCVEKAIGAIANPSNLAAESEQLGAYQHSQTFPRSLDAGVFLTAYERREVRRAANLESLRAVEYETWPEEATSDLDFTFPLES